jgi:hypothetical protein
LGGSGLGLSAGLGSAAWITSAIATRAVAWDLTASLRLVRLGLKRLAAACPA